MESKTMSGMHANTGGPISDVPGDEEFGEGVAAGDRAFALRTSGSSSGSSRLARAGNTALKPEVERLKKGVEEQVRQHPARTLLMALGAGIVIGKIFRR